MGPFRNESGGCTDDARPGKPIVQSAMIAAEQRGEEAEARRDGEQEPDERADERAPEIKRRAGSTVTTLIPAAIFPSVCPPAVKMTR